MTQDCDCETDAGTMGLTLAEECVDGIITVDVSLDPELEFIQAISDRLETGLNHDALRAITDLLRAGVHPDAVVAAVTSLHQQMPRS